MATVKSTRFRSSLVWSVLFFSALMLLPAAAAAQGYNQAWRLIDAEMPRPTSGYLVDDRFYPIPRNYLVAPNVGHNESRWFPDGRTGWTAEPVRVRHQGQGDAGPMSVYCATEGARNPLALDWGAEKACFGINGMVEARTPGTSLAGFEFHGQDNGMAGVSAYMGVLEYNRQGGRGDTAWEPVTGLLRLQSVGKPVDSLANLYGAAEVGIDLTGQFTEDGYATSLALPEGGRIYWRAKPGPPPHGTVDKGGTWTGYMPIGTTDDGFGIGAWLVTIEHETIFQVWRDWVVVDGGIAGTGELNLNGLPELPTPAPSTVRALCIDTANGRVYVAQGAVCS